MASVCDDFHSPILLNRKIESFVLVLFVLASYIHFMSPASRSKTPASKTPPLAAVPSAPPVGAVAPFGEPGSTLVDKERRRGRGAQSNASGRFEAEARVAFDDGWQSFEDLPPFKTTAVSRFQRAGTKIRVRSKARPERPRWARNLASDRRAVGE